MSKEGKDKLIGSVQDKTTNESKTRIMIGKAILTKALFLVTFWFVIRVSKVSDLPLEFPFLVLLHIQLRHWLRSFPPLMPPELSSG